MGGMWYVKNITHSYAPKYYYWRRINNKGQVTRFAFYAAYAFRQICHKFGHFMSYIEATMHQTRISWTQPMYFGLKSQVTRVAFYAAHQSLANLSDIYHLISHTEMQRNNRRIEVDQFSDFACVSRESNGCWLRKRCHKCLGHYA